MYGEKIINLELPQPTNTSQNGFNFSDDPVGYLDDLLDTDPVRAKNINMSLMSLPSDTVLDDFGVEVAAWTVANVEYMREEEDLLHTLDQKAGINLADFEASRSWVYRQTYKTYGRYILAQYNLMQATKNDILADIDLPEIIRDCALDGVTLTKKRLGRYALIPLETQYYNMYYNGGHVKGWSDEISPTTAYNMWLDTPIGFALTYNGLPNAMAGLAMTGTSEVMAYQLQGVKGQRIDPDVSRYSEDRVVGSTSSRGLAPLDWKKALVEVVETIGKRLETKNVGIQAAKNNVWTKKRMPRDTEPHLSIEDAKLVYDKTAMRLGYSKSQPDKKGNWHKTVTH